MTLRELFKEDLEEAASCGLLSERLYHFLIGVFRHMNLSTQHMEGNNNIVKHLVRRAPHISWSLISSRYTAHKEVATASAGRELAASCLAYHEETVRDLNDRASQTARWELEPTLPAFPSLPEGASARGSNRYPTNLRSTRMTVRLMKYFTVQLTYEKALRFTPTPDPERVPTDTNPFSMWMPVHEFRNTLWMAAGEEQEGPNSVMIFVLSRPLVFRPFHRVVAAAAEHLDSGDEVDVVVDHVELRWDHARIDCATVGLGASVSLKMFQPCGRTAQTSGSSGSRGDDYDADDDAARALLHTAENLSDVVEEDEGDAFDPVDAIQTADVNAISAAERRQAEQAVPSSQLGAVASELQGVADPSAFDEDLVVEAYLGDGLRDRVEVSEQDTSVSLRRKLEEQLGVGCAKLQISTAVADR